MTHRAAALHIGHMLSRVALTGTIVRLGEALPVVFFSSAVDFILPVNCRRSTTAVRAASGTAGKMNSPEAEPRHAGRHAAGGAACRGSASGEFILPAVPDAARTAVVKRRKLTGKMKSTALEKNTSGSAWPRRTIVLSLTTASSVILVLKETEAAKADAWLVGFGPWARFGLGLGRVEFWISTRP